MKKGFLCGFLLFVVSVTAQTKSDFEKKYGSETYYEIRPKVLMSAQFDKEGQVCSVSFQPNRMSKSEKTDYLGIDTLETEDLKEIFDELVPPQTREGKFESMGSLMIGNMAFSAVRWDNVRFNAKYGFGRKYTNERKNNKPNDLSQKDKEGIDLLFSFGSPDLAFITWTKRKCAE
jgi:hypothetical protein